jgi:hypothetical protein
MSNAGNVFSSDVGTHCETPGRPDKRRCSGL